MADTKSINSLMKKMRTETNIAISGSRQKKELLNMGYFHGYKGYRFVRTKKDGIPFNNFDQIIAISQFDNNLKELFYKPIMFLETSWKSHCIETCIKLASEDFSKIYDIVLNDYKELNPSHKNYNERVRRRLKVRESVFTTISYKYKSSTILQHYQYNDRSIPIWAIFEIITLGLFGEFVRSMNKTARRDLMTNLHLFYGEFDGDCRLLEHTVFFISDLRNAIAHNSIIFDGRFNNSSPSPNIKKMLTHEVGVSFTTFASIIDYLAFIVIFLKKAGISKNERRKMVRTFQFECEKLRKSVPTEVYDKILGSDSLSKLSVLLNY
ncbi:MAG TPA: Abi family protein [Clostridiaceae bacterium]|nr:Abi family protein [Clostridiaceae bacterium]